MGHDSIQKISISFYPLYPSQKCLFLQNLAILALFGTFWIFFDHLYPPKKNKKNTILAQFCHFVIFWHFWDFFYPVELPKNDYFGKIWPFWHSLALFWGGVKIAKKKIMLF